MTVRISSLTKEYVKVPARGEVAGGPANLAQYTLKMAFPAEGNEPEVTDWVNGDWETWPDDFYMARVLVGPGSDKALPDGNYDVWINVVTPSEDIKRRVDRLVVT